jgi:hypothetical protein
MEDGLASKSRAKVAGASTRAINAQDGLASRDLKLRVA